MRDSRGTAAADTRVAACHSGSSNDGYACDDGSRSHNPVVGCDRPNIAEERARSERALRAIGSTAEASLGDLVRLAACGCRTPLALFLYGDEQPQAIWAVVDWDGPEPAPPVAFVHETA